MAPARIHFEDCRVATIAAIPSAITNSTAKATTNNAGGQGSFGAQYYVSNRFALFGELGVGFSHTETKSNLTPTKGTSWAWGTRSAVGIIFYP